MSQTFVQIHSFSKQKSNSTFCKLDWQWRILTIPATWPDILRREGYTMVVTDCIVLWCGVIEAPQWNCERTIHNPVLCQYNISLVHKFKMLYTYITIIHSYRYKRQWSILQFVIISSEETSRLHCRCCSSYIPVMVLVCRTIKLEIDLDQTNTLPLHKEDLNNPPLWDWKWDNEEEFFFLPLKEMNYLFIAITFLDKKVDDYFANKIDDFHSTNERKSCEKPHCSSNGWQHVHWLCCSIFSNSVKCWSVKIYPHIL